MALIRNTEAVNNTVTVTVTENEDVNPFTEQATEEVVQAAPAPAPIAVVQQAANAVTLPPNSMAARLAAADVYSQLYNLFQVTWDSVPTIKASQGRFAEGSRNLGDTLMAELLSWQDQWLISPGGQNTPENAKLARYSDDGVTTSKGENCQEYLRNLIAAGHTKASMSKRLIIVLVLDTCDKAPDLVGMPVQISCAPTSLGKFNALRNQITFKVSRGLLTPEAAVKIKLVADPVKTNGNDYTVINFAMQ